MTAQLRGIVLALGGVALALFYYWAYIGGDRYAQMRQEYADNRQKFLAGFGLDSRDPGAMVKLEQIIRQDADARKRFTEFADGEEERQRAIKQAIRPGGIAHGLWSLGTRLGTFRSPAQAARPADFWPGMVQVFVLVGLGGYWSIWHRRAQQG